MAYHKSTIYKRTLLLILPDLLTIKVIYVHGVYFSVDVVILDNKFLAAIVDSLTSCIRPLCSEREGYPRGPYRNSDLILKSQLH